MEEEIVVIIAEDDDGHAMLVNKNLKRGGVINKTIRFRDGEEVLDFLFRNKEGLKREVNISYMMLLDMRMPKVDGLEVLRRVKEDPDLRRMPIIMLTTTDDPIEVNKCHVLGCNSYIVKPIRYDKFVEVIVQLGIFIKMVQIPKLIEEQSHDYS
jgi:CheY-like chemotaxis protein